MPVRRGKAIPDIDTQQLELQSKDFMGAWRSYSIKKPHIMNAAAEFFEWKLSRVADKNKVNTDIPCSYIFNIGYKLMNCTYDFSNVEKVFFFPTKEREYRWRVRGVTQDLF